MQTLIQRFLVLLVLLSFIQTISIDNQLPPLDTIQCDYRLKEHMNITVGEQFSIVLPQFDLNKKPESFKVYEITQQKFISIFETLEKHEEQNDDNQNKVEIIGNDIFSCQVQMPSMYISKTIDTISIKAAGYFDYNSEESMIYVPIATRSLLYTLDTSSMEVTAYHYTEKSINFLSSAKIKLNHEKICMASSSSEQYIYVFSSLGMWQIQTKTVLTNVKNLENGLNSFSSVQNRVDKMLHGAHGYLYGIQRNSAVYVIPQQKTQQKFKTINTFGNEKIIPQDIFVEARKIYILDSRSGIYIYRLIGSGEIQEQAKIEIQTQMNLQILVRQYSIFVKYSDHEGHKIIELNYNPDEKTAKLVRYYKTDQIVKQMSIQLAVVSAQNKNSESSRQGLLFLTTDNGQIQTYPYNIDPRTILSVHNGPKMHLEGVQKVFNLYSNLYLIATPDKIIYARIQIKKPELVCVLPQSTGHIYYQLQFTANISTCEHYDHTIAHKTQFNTNCQLKQSLTLFINDPELSRFQKVVLYGIVLLVVGGFIAGVLCLIQWRDNKLSLIGRIKDEILRFRDRQRKMQPFTEQQDNHKREVEFQMPPTQQFYQIK